MQDMTSSTTKANSANAIPAARTEKTPLSSLRSTVLAVFSRFGEERGQYFFIQYLSSPASDILTILQQDLYIDNNQLVKSEQN